jgi:hypothetical protein
LRDRAHLVELGLHALQLKLELARAPRLRVQLLRGRAETRRVRGEHGAERIGRVRC